MPFPCTIKQVEDNIYINILLLCCRYIRKSLHIIIFLMADCYITIN